MGYKRYIPTYTSRNACGCEFEVEVQIVGCCEMHGDDIEVGETVITNICSDHSGW